MIADPLRNPAAVRERCANITAAATAGQSAHFTIDRSRLPAVADEVAAVTRRRYPDGRIPYHSRWRHFEAGGIDRTAELDARLAQIFGTPSAGEAARARIDLTVISVLLDAGAGDTWSYSEPRTGQQFTRSEGLAVATFRAFLAGAFSSKPDDPCRVDGNALQRIDAARLAHVFQAHADNPLIGLESRAQLLNRLGDTLLRDAQRFGPEGRPGEIFIRVSAKGRRQELPAPELLHILLAGLGDIWLTGPRTAGQAMGDCWPHPLAGGTGPTAGWVPFHKLSQWLTYSLLEPFEQAGIRIVQLDELTGLPEYRNGGLLIDGGVIVPRDPQLLAMPMTPGDMPTIEWRAFTVSLLDELAPLVRERLGLDAAAMPLARMLEGGTWAAGREAAARLRNGRPPMNIVSDGTVF